MDIGSGRGYPESALSNFSPHEFTIDGVKCASIEGFLQSLKFKDVAMQEHVCSLVGKAAKFKGKKKKWWREQVLYWRCVPINRHSEYYQDLLNRAFWELMKNASFKKALLATGNATLTHSIVKSNEKETVLTEREFCNRLTNMRTYLTSGEAFRKRLASRYENG